jgi:hypothetical protein
MSVEWLKNSTPGTMPRDREVDNGPTAIEKSCFQEIRELKSENAKLKKQLDSIRQEI